MTEPVEIKTFPDGLPAWLIEQAQKLDVTLLLAHADDGVIWGRIDAGKLVLSGEAFPELAVALRESTLQQVRLFGPKGELNLWRSGGDFNYNIVQDVAETVLEETYRLWGESDAKTNSGFTLMREGEMGYLHAVPITGKAGSRAQLVVRHYVAYDDTGAAYIKHSRLVGLQWVSKNEAGEGNDGR